MIKQIADASPRRLARIAGVMWLLVVVGGIFAEATAGWIDYLFGAIGVAFGAGDGRLAAGEGHPAAREG